MKTARYFIVAMGLALLLSSCFMSNPWLSEGEGDSVYLPPDVIKDTTRSSSEPFQFETLLPVTLNLEIDFYELDTKGTGSKFAEIPAAVGDAVVVVTNSKGNVVYEGGIEADGTLNARLVLPADPEDMVLTVKAQGYQDRSVKISNLVNYDTIDRKMGLMSEGLSAKDDVVSDSDNDLVPDIYDAFPRDPNYAFVLHYPDAVDQSMTVAYEDLYLRADAGDADYNDFLAKYAIEERSKLSKEGRMVLTYLGGEVTAEVKIAGYDHLFGIAFGYNLEDGEVLTGDATVSYTDSDGARPSPDPQVFDLADLLVPIPEPNESPFNSKIVVPLFGDTEEATHTETGEPVKKTASFQIDFPNEGIQREKLQLAPYDPFLYVWDTHYDIHLVGETPLSAIPTLPGIDPVLELKSASTTGPYTFMDSEGFPWALLVPVDWEHPAETQRIEEVYPFFTNWRLSEGAGDTNWYLRPMDDTNDPPGMPTVSPANLEFDSTVAGPQDAAIDVTVGTDTDGDDAAVTLKWTTPTSYVTIAANDVGPESHKVTVDLTKVLNVPEELLIYFWSEDGEGARSDFAEVKLTFVEPAAFLLVIETFTPAAFNENDTYLTLFRVERDADDNVISSSIIAEDNNGNPDRTNNRGCSRITLTEALELGDYYIKVHKPTPAGNPNYGLRIVDFDPGTSFPDIVPANEIGDSDTVDEVVESGITRLIPDNPKTIALGDVVSRSIFPEETDIDCFVFTVE